MTSTNLPNQFDKTILLETDSNVTMTAFAPLNLPVNGEASWAPVRLLLCTHRGEDVLYCIDGL